jgi:hypothetical protein
MKKYILLGLLSWFSFLILHGQEQPKPPSKMPISSENFTLRPNSRDYAIIRKGNNHQRMIQVRSQAMMRHRQALQNRKMSMEHRKTALQRQMIRQQQVRQRMVHQRGMQH